MRAGLFWAALSVGAAGCGAPAPVSEVPPVPPSFAAALASRPKSGVKVLVYNTGSVTVRSRLVSERRGWLSKTRLDIPVFLVRHPRGLILFDTGLPPAMETRAAVTMGRLNHFFVPFTMGPGQNAAAQLAAGGIAPEHVDFVVISHLHPDHAGMIDAFPRAEVLVDKREWEAQRERRAAHPGSWEPDPAELEGRLKLRLVDLSTAPAYGAFEHAQDLFGDGSVVLVDMAGHTAGSLGAWINMDEGPVLLAGDASWVLDNHRDLALPIRLHIFDVDQYTRRLLMMRAMQKAVPGLVICPGHDLSPLSLQPRADVTLMSR